MSAVLATCPNCNAPLVTAHAGTRGPYTRLLLDNITLGRSRDAPQIEGVCRRCKRSVVVPACDAWPPPEPPAEKEAVTSS